MVNYTEKENKALCKAYEILFGENPDRETLERLELDNTLTINKARNGRDVAWYADEVNNIAVYVDTLEELQEEEIDDQLC